jgi:hypothetical protein
MKKYTITTLIIAALILIGVWVWNRARAEAKRAYQGTTQMVLSGPTGVVITGHCVQDGRRIAISNALPWSFEQERISSFEIRKLNPDDTLVVDMSYDGDGAHAKMKKPLGPGVPGIRVQIQNGLISETVERAR